MNSRLCCLLPLVLVSVNSFAQETMYCPGNHAFIQLGMTPDQVIAACGQPLTKNTPNQPVTTRVPVKQLIYTNLNKGSQVYPTLDPIYNQWSLSQGSEGITLEIDILHNKVSAIRINGSGANAASICNNGNIQRGTPESQVYNACGSPDHINNTFINQPVPSNDPPEVWIYRPTPYQPPFKLTFTNGKLQSIEQ